MGTELFSACVKDENLDIPSVPPGFEAFASFALKRVEEKSTVINCLESVSASQLQSAQTGTELDIGNSAKLTRSLRRKPWINRGHYSNSSEDECEVDQLQQSLPASPGLPKGVIRGCPECSNCQKVIAKWRPQDACKPDVVDAPVFYPNEEEFEDTLKYIASIRLQAEPYGICRIVPPPSWKPPCPLKEKSVWESSKFTTRVQRIDKLQNRNSMRKMSKIQNHARRKRRKCMRMAVDCGVGGANTMGPGDAGHLEAESFGFEPGPAFTLDTFQKYADDFKAQYFGKNKTVRDMGGNMSTIIEHWEPSLEIIEGEYWRMVEKPTEEIEVLYGADLETGTFGSGFPKRSNQVSSTSDEKYIKSGWNLNTFPRLPGSVLSYEGSDISGVLVPWLYIGMCFSSFCWHVEDHHLYSLNYMHWGAPKLWYGVAACDALKLEAVMRKHLPDLFEEQPDLLHKLVTQLSPSILKSEGVPVFRCVQNPGEFVLTFPRAYHSGFNSGFNCAEAVNVAPVDWLPHGQNAVELYREQGRRTSISHDKLLLGAAREAVKAHWELNLLKKNTTDNLRWKAVCGKDGILTRALKARVEIERTRREFLCNSSQAMKMESSFDATSERECTICLFDLHLSAAGCHCSPDRYACLNHAKQLCECAWSDKFFLFRYDINELDIFVQALEGKLSAVYRWAKLDLGLDLSSAYSRGNMQFPGKAVKDVNPQHSVSITGLGGKEGQTRIINETLLQQPEKLLTAVLALKASPSRNRSVLETKVKKEESVLPVSDLSLPCCQVSKEDTSYAENSSDEAPEVKKLGVSGLDSVILLSDDEGEEPKKVISSGTKETTLAKGPEIVKNIAVNDDKGSAPETRERDLKSSHSEERSEHSNKDGIVLGSNMSSQLGSVGANCDKNLGKNIDANVSSHLVNRVRGTMGQPSFVVNNVNKGLRPGPRIAKVVRRINSNVEPIEFGSVLDDKSWCNKQAIFPKGFKSRVRYISVLDPTNMSYYVSEILEASGSDRPLFMVSLEHCRTEVFIHISAAKCWELVRDRVNMEIAKQHKWGRKNLPPLQPPGSLDGLEMFGFSSPVIVQAVEALDRNRVCKEYWDSRPYSRPQVQVPLSVGNSGRSDHQETCRTNSASLNGVDTILGGLFKKANPEELNTLYGILRNEKSTADENLVTQVLREEIHKRLR